MIRTIFFYDQPNSLTHVNRVLPRRSDGANLLICVVFDNTHRFSASVPHEAPSPSRSHIIHHCTRVPDDGTLLDASSRTRHRGGATTGFSNGSVYRVSSGGNLPGGRLQNSPLLWHTHANRHGCTLPRLTTGGQRSANIALPHAASFLGPLFFALLFFRKRWIIACVNIGVTPTLAFRHAEEHRLPPRKVIGLPQPTPGTARQQRKEGILKPSTKLVLHVISEQNLSRSRLTDQRRQVSLVRG